MQRDTSIIQTTMNVLGKGSKRIYRYDFYIFCKHIVAGMNVEIRDRCSGLYFHESIPRDYHVTLANGDAPDPT